MLKLLCLTFLVIGLCQGSAINFPKVITPEQFIQPAAKSDVADKWLPLILEFVDLIDIETLIPVVLKHITDPELIRFLEFLLSPQIVEVVWDIQSLAEFKEGYIYLENKGYDVETLVNLINSLLNLPQFELRRSVARAPRGLTDFLEDLLAALPVQEMKALFEKKLEEDTDLKELFETVNSEEFLDILRRLSLNPKFNEIKGLFEGYGFDFKFICNIADEIVGEHFEGIIEIFCD